MDQALEALAAVWNRLDPDVLRPFLNDTVRYESFETELALELARYDGFDPGRYPGFDELHAKLRLEVSREIVRRAVRSELRGKLADQHVELRTVDYQEDDDVRAAVVKLAAQTDLDLTEIAAYEDLAP